MNGKIKKKIIITALAAAFIIAAAFACAVIGFGIAFNSEIALVETLKARGLDCESAERLIDDYMEFTEAEGIDKTDAVYRISVEVSRLGDGALAEAVSSYDEAKGIKNVFTLFEYAGLYDKIKRIPSGNNVLKDMSPYRRKAFLNEVNSLMNAVADAGEDKYYESVTVVKEVIGSENFAEKVPYKSMLKAAQYFIDVTAKVDFSKFYILDAAFGEGFTDRYSMGIASCVAVVRDTDTGELIDALLNLPIKERVLVAFANLALDDPNFNLGAFSALAAAVLNYSDTQTPQNIIDDEYILQSLYYAGQLNPNALTEEEVERLKEILSVFSEAFSAAKENLSCIALKLGI